MPFSFLILSFLTEDVVLKPQSNVFLRKLGPANYFSKGFLEY